MKATLSRQALRDLTDAARWIAQDNPGAARAFRKSVDDAAARIGSQANIGVLRPHLASAPYRFLVLRDFPYILVYNATRRPPRVVRILHGARDLPALLDGL
ncbi:MULTISPECIES: type II toxin-antitoxin system RelE/ParE family toxin [Inquilinus]|uniref:Toxin ParE1/3/4 n=1 Tax=Inquilinus ginsengisoli TaxID=363840 RepID=A0ABU1JMF1_9PROT|nr:type II toxin-antitoxin system RelE/ParE family toxin [Inquilinus ginsengisoli]MDR6288739.1 toxin ParE1/3/4 [Inquilinus ginsengisoli]